MAHPLVPLQRWGLFEPLCFFLLRPSPARTVQSCPIAVHPSILTIHCLLLNLSVLACYSFPCISKLILAETPPMGTGLGRRSHSTPLFPMVSGLFCTIDARNPFVIYRFRTLSIAMGVYTPSPFSTHPPSVRSTSTKSTHELRTFSQQLLSLPHLRFFRGKGVSRKSSTDRFPFWGPAQTLSC
jgi:hypothetical protein